MGRSRTMSISSSTGWWCAREQTRLDEAVSQALDAGKGCMTFESRHGMKRSSFRSMPIPPNRDSPTVRWSRMTSPSITLAGCVRLARASGRSKNLISKRSLIQKRASRKTAASSQVLIKRSALEISTTIWPGSTISVSTLPGKSSQRRPNKIFLYGTEKNGCRCDFVHPTKNQSWTEYVQWRGVLHEAKQTVSKKRRAMSTGKIWKS